MMRALFSFVVVAVLMALVLAFPRVASANAPPPWHSCQEQTAGDTCDPYGADNGICTVQPACSDDPETELNECLWCEAADGGGCSVVGTPGSSGAWAMLLGCVLFAVYRRGRRG